MGDVFEPSGESSDSTQQPGLAEAKSTAEVVNNETAGLMMNSVKKILKRTNRLSFEVSEKKYDVNIKLFKSRNKEYLRVDFSAKGEKLQNFSYLFSEDNNQVKVVKSSASYSKVPDLDQKKITKIYDWVLDKV